MITSTNWASFGNHEPSDYSSVEAIRIADNIVASQRLNGGWKRKLKVGDIWGDLVAIRATQLQLEQDYDVAILENFSYQSASLDEGSAASYIQYLLRVAESTQSQVYIDAAKLGLNYILMAQYGTGGWPQTYPSLVGYGAYVTLNDKAMTSAMTLVKDIIDHDYIAVDDTTKLEAIESLDKAVSYILRSQIMIGGVLSGWCAQHDPITYEPLGARSFELPSVGGYVTVLAVKFLMSIDNPSCDVVKSVWACLEWLDENQIKDKAWVKAYDKGLKSQITIQIKEDPLSSEDPKDYTYTEAGYDKKLVDSVESDPLLWARFYDLDNGRPLFSTWDGLAQRSEELIDYSLRIGYSWYGSWAKTVINSSSWKAANPKKH